MMYYYYRYIKAPQYFKNDKGITNFAEYLLSILTTKSTKKIGKAQKRIAILTKKKDSLKDDLEEIKNHTLHPAEYHKVKHNYKSWKNSYYTLITTEGGLNLATIHYVMDEENVSIVWIAGKGGIALVITLAGVLGVELALSSFFPHKGENRKNLLGIVGVIIFIIVEVAIFYLGTTRGELLEGGMGSASKALLIIAMVTPLIAGIVGYLKSSIINKYKTTKTNKKIKKKIDKINIQLKEEKKSISAFIKEIRTKYWTLLKIFQSHKENYNKQKSITETSDFCSTFYNFELEAEKRLQDELNVKSYLRSYSEITENVYN